MVPLRRPLTVIDVPLDDLLATTIDHQSYQPLFLVSVPTNLPLTYDMVLLRPFKSRRLVAPPTVSLYVRLTVDKIRLSSIRLACRSKTVSRMIIIG